MKLFIKLLVITIKCCIHSFLLVITNVLSRGFIIFVKSWCLCCLQIIICLFPHSLYYRLIQCTFLKNIFVLLFLLDFEDKWLWFIILFLMGIGIYLLWWDKRFGCFRWWQLIKSIWSTTPLLYRNWLFSLFNILF